MVHGLFSLQFSRFSFALGGFCHFHPFNGFLCNFHDFPLLWAASAKLLKKLQFPSFQWGVLPFSSFACVLGRSIWENCSKSCYFHAFRIARKPHFYDFFAPKPNFFRPLPRFPAEFEHDSTYN